MSPGCDNQEIRRQLDFDAGSRAGCETCPSCGIEGRESPIGPGWLTVELGGQHQIDGHPCKDRQIARLTAERDALKAVVDKLPKTADGVTVSPGMHVFVLRDDGPIECHAVFTVQFNGCHSTNGAGIGLPDGCYSTREAAEAAKENDDGE